VPELLAGVVQFIPQHQRFTKPAQGVLILLAKRIAGVTPMRLARSLRHVFPVLRR
jgi:hypothetical protein